MADVADVADVADLRPWRNLALCHSTPYRPHHFQGVPCGMRHDNARGYKLYNCRKPAGFIFTNFGYIVHCGKPGGARGARGAGVPGWGARWGAGVVQ